MMAHYMYVIGPVIQDEAILKIGISHDVKRRLASLQASGPVRLELLAVWEFEDRNAAYRSEQLAHHVFRRRRAHFEWFRVPLNSVEKFMGRATYLDRSKYGAMWEGIPTGLRVTGEMKKTRPLVQRMPARIVTTAPSVVLSPHPETVSPAPTKEKAPSKSAIIADILRHRRALLAA